jgi:5-methylcytosine-specific restriction endonuclease McrA
MPNFVCKRCGYETITKQNLRKHLQRKTPCKAIDESCDFPLDNLLKEIDVQFTSRFECKYCNKQFTESCNRYRHQKSCSVKQNIHIKDIQEPKRTVNQTSPQHKKQSKKKIPQIKRILCWNTYIGEEVGKALCLCCNTFHITQHNFHCGHVVAEANGGSLLIENLRPICDKCNIAMGTQDMREFAKQEFDIDIE